MQKAEKENFQLSLARMDSSDIREALVIIFLLFSSDFFVFPTQVQGKKNGW